MLNVIGLEQVFTAMQRCFASLWTDRVTQYRSNLGLAPRSVRLAVVGQRMVEAEGGRPFHSQSADRETTRSRDRRQSWLGRSRCFRRNQPGSCCGADDDWRDYRAPPGQQTSAIQAAARGGIQQIEAGASPTHSCLSGEQIRTLAAIGARVEALYEAPQDIEWAIDPSGQVFLLQARPITTLFPLPAGAPSSDEHLTVYMAFGVQQGTYRPFTPMGQSAPRAEQTGWLEASVLGSALLNQAGMRLLLYWR